MRRGRSPSSVSPMLKAVRPSGHIEERTISTGGGISCRNGRISYWGLAMSRPGVFAGLVDAVAARALLRTDRRIKECKAEVQRIRRRYKSSKVHRDAALEEFSKALLQTVFRPEHFSLEWLYETWWKGSRAGGLYAIYKRNLEMGGRSGSEPIDWCCRWLDHGDADPACTREALQLMQLFVGGSDIPEPVAARICALLHQVELQGGLKRRSVRRDFNRKSHAVFVARSRRIYQADRCLLYLGVKPASIRYDAIAAATGGKLESQTIEIYSKSFRRRQRGEEARLLGIES